MVNAGVSDYSGGGAGTVTSFSAGALSPLFTTAVATPTTTPALSFVLSTHLANTFFSGPASGGAAAPTFRVLNLNDFNDAGGVNTWDWRNRLLLDTLAAHSIDWNNRQAIDSLAQLSIDWEGRGLNDGTITSLDWIGRTLSDSAALSSADWGARLLLDATGGFISIDWGNRNLIDNIGNNSVDWKNRIMRDSTTILSVDWENHKLADHFNFSMDWASRLLIDAFGVTALNYSNRELTGVTGVSPASWDDNRFTIKTGAFLDVIDNHAAPALAGGAPVFTDYYGGNTNALGDPDDWMPVVLNGVPGVIPFYHT